MASKAMVAVISLVTSATTPQGEQTQITQNQQSVYTKVYYTELQNKIANFKTIYKSLKYHIEVLQNEVIKKDEDFFKTTFKNFHDKEISDKAIEKIAKKKTAIIDLLYKTERKIAKAKLLSFEIGNKSYGYTVGIEKFKKELKQLKETIDVIAKHSYKVGFIKNHFNHLKSWEEKFEKDLAYYKESKDPNGSIVVTYIQNVRKLQAFANFVLNKVDTTQLDVKSLVSKVKSAIASEKTTLDEKIAQVNTILSALQNTIFKIKESYRQNPNHFILEGNQNLYNAEIIDKIDDSVANLYPLIRDKDPKTFVNIIAKDIANDLVYVTSIIDKVAKNKATIASEKVVLGKAIKRVKTILAEVEMHKTSPHYDGTKITFIKANLNFYKEYTTSHQATIDEIKNSLNKINTMHESLTKMLNSINKVQFYKELAHFQATVRGIVKEDITNAYEVQVKVYEAWIKRLDETTTSKAYQAELKIIQKQADAILAKIALSEVAKNKATIASEQTSGASAETTKIESTTSRGRSRRTSEQVTNSEAEIYKKLKTKFKELKLVHKKIQDYVSAGKKLDSHDKLMINQIKSFSETQASVIEGIKEDQEAIITVLYNVEKLTVKAKHIAFKFDVGAEDYGYADAQATFRTELTKFEKTVATIEGHQNEEFQRLLNGFKDFVTSFSKYKSQNFLVTTKEHAQDLSYIYHTSHEAIDYLNRLREQQSYANFVLNKITELDD